MKVAHTFGETPERVALLKTIWQLAWTTHKAEFTHEEIAEAAGRDCDVHLRFDLAYLRAVRLIEGEIESEDDRWAVPLTVSTTLYGNWEAHAEPLLPAEKATLTEIVRALRTPDADHFYRLTAVHHPRAEIEAMDEDQRARLEQIRAALELLALPTRNEAARQLKALRALLAEVNAGGGRGTMAHWLTHLDRWGEPLTSQVDSYEELDYCPAASGRWSATTAPPVHD
jgi:hypothetical protein